MANESRVRNTFFNFTTSIGGQLLTILMQFVIRTVFIHTLGKSYLGINGLFSNILSMLSLAEMGLGSAIVFKLYEPIAMKDQQRIAVLMKFYKTIYRYIGMVIAILGVALIPFLPKLIADYDRLTSLNLNAALVFGLYLFDSVASYFFFAYKSALIKANQKEYMINVIGYVFTILQGIVQIICLLLFKSFIMYVIVISVKTILQNLVIARLADTMYPYINKPLTESLSKDESKGIFKDCGALFIYKVNNVVVKSTDNLVLSAFIGLEAVALYSNYYIFYTTINSLLNKLYNSVGHSIGNLHTTHDTKKEYAVFETTMLIAAIMGGIVFAGIFCVADEFIELWIGRDWVIAQPFALLLGLELYTTSFKQAIAKYRTAYGLFKQGWVRPLISMILNLGISVALVKPLGIVGVLIGTVAADWLTFIWYDPLVVHRVGFNKAYPVSRYFLKFTKYFITCSAAAALDYYICHSFFVGCSWASVIVHAIICTVTVLVTLLLVSFRTEEGQYVIRLIRKELKAVEKKFFRRKKRGK